jgi:signal transduction histidine kinase
MSSARRLPSLRRRIVTVALAAGALLFLLAGGLVVAVSWSVLWEDWNEVLSEISGPVADACAETGGDPAAMERVFRDTVEFYGADVSLLLAAPDGSPVLRTGGADAAPARRNRGAVRVRETALPDGSRLVVSLDVSDERRILVRLAVITVGAFLLALLLGGLSADWLARRFVRSLGNVSDAAARIRSGEWSARVVPTRESRETALLEDAFNTMCDRNERTIVELRTLTDDIAHDLRTPLTRLRTAAEYAAMGGRPKTPLPDFVFAETSGMLEMVNTLLDISRAGGGLDGAPRESVDLCAFLRETADLYAALLEDRRLHLVLDLPPGPLPFPARRDRLQRIAGNLLDNAVKFTPDGGSITLSLVRTDGGVRFCVADTGCGIAPEDLPNVYRRFWRADASRTLPGNGLGLALVQALVRAAGGTISCDSAPGRGTRFTVFLPEDAA